MKTAVVLGFLLPAAFVLLASGAGHCGKADFVVAIDIGHSRIRPGATSARGVGEFHFNKELAVLLRRELAGTGFTSAFLINEDGSNMPLTQRAELANTKKAALFLSIHHDSVQPRYLSTWSHEGVSRAYSDKFRGYSLFYSPKNREKAASLLFAELIGTELRARGLEPTIHHAENIEGEGRELVDRYRGIYRFDDLVVLKTASMPAVLLECGIIVNRDEEVRLADATYRKTIVQAVTLAIETYYCRLAGVE
jgi:N-acetylmuramoyl-L-alanine amidase